ncbi:MAG: transcriptional regulator PhoU [Methanomassiliicoccales archaeon PtaU1.Bin124]|nr:MAG: transcriptional regulator PhoU [Methanomassiliicoccales archaeon PtaU1.Bin124]
MKMTSRVQFTHELESLDREVEEMAGLARSAIEKSVRLIVTGDYELRDEVRRLDKEIYRYDNMIEKHCLDIIALHTPVAGDLRNISTCLKIIEDLNRIGRYAWDIAEVAEEFEGQKFKRMVNIPHMADLVVGMVSDAIDCFVRRDAVEARRMFDRDDEVDALYDTVFRETLTYLFEDPSRITVGIQYILVARYLERVADHACNIGERVVFMVTGERWDPTLRKRNGNGNGHAPVRGGSDLSEELTEEGYNQHELSEK